MKSIIDRVEYVFCAILIIIGVCAVILVFFNSSLQLQIMVVLAGVGFICLGLLHLNNMRDKKENLIKLEQIITKLEGIKQELEKKEKPEGAGIAIADIISSGLKYYTESMNKVKDDE